MQKFVAMTAFAAGIITAALAQQPVTPPIAGVAQVSLAAPSSIIVTHKRNG